MSFSDVFREERFFCNHFFRLLCHNLQGGGEAGLACVIAELDRVAPEAWPPSDSPQIYTEVAALRDIFYRALDKDSLLESLYDLFLPLIAPEYRGLFATPVRPAVVRDRLGIVHPSKYADEIREPEFERSDVLFYREFGALFNAKPDFLVLLPGRALWIEAKVESSFSSSQIQRMCNIAALCASPLLTEYFAERRPEMVLLGSQARHVRAQRIPNAKFISWGRCADIGARVFYGGTQDVSVQAFYKAERGQASLA